MQGCSNFSRKYFVTVHLGVAVSPTIVPRRGCEIRAAVSSEKVTQFYFEIKLTHYNIN